MNRARAFSLYRHELTAVSLERLLGRLDPLYRRFAPVCLLGCSVPPPTNHGRFCNPASTAFPLERSAVRFSRGRQHRLAGAGLSLSISCRVQRNRSAGAAVVSVLAGPRVTMNLPGKPDPAAGVIDITESDRTCVGGVLGIVEH